MKKHMLFIICTEFFLLFVLSDIKCMAAFPEEAQAAEEKGALEGIPEELSSLWNENYMQECLEYRTILEYGTIFIKQTRKPAEKVY